MKNFCSSIREHATIGINFEKKKMLHVTFVKELSQKSLLKIKIMEMLATIAILRVNTKVQHIVSVI